MGNLQAWKEPQTGLGTTGTLNAELLGFSHSQQQVKFFFPSRLYRVMHVRDTCTFLLAACRVCMQGIRGATQKLLQMGTTKSLLYGEIKLLNNTWLFSKHAQKLRPLFHLRNASSVCTCNVTLMMRLQLFTVVHCLSWSKASPIDHILLLWFQVIQSQLLHFF